MEDLYSAVSFEVEGDGDKTYLIHLNMANSCIQKINYLGLDY